MLFWKALISESRICFSWSPSNSLPDPASDADSSFSGEDALKPNSGFGSWDERSSGDAKLFKKKREFLFKLFII